MVCSNLCNSFTPQRLNDLAEIWKFGIVFFLHETATKKNVKWYQYLRVPIFGMTRAVDNF